MDLPSTINVDGPVISDGPVASSSSSSNVRSRPLFLGQSLRKVMQRAKRRSVPPPNGSCVSMRNGSSSISVPSPPLCTQSAIFLPPLNGTVYEEDEEGESGPRTCSSSTNTTAATATVLSTAPTNGVRRSRRKGSLFGWLAFHRQRTVRQEIVGDHNHRETVAASASQSSDRSTTPQEHSALPTTPIDGSVAAPPSCSTTTSSAAYPSMVSSNHSKQQQEDLLYSNHTGGVNT